MSATVFWADGAEFATLTNVFKVGGVPADATTVILTVTDPTGTATTPAVTHAGTGTYTANVACTIAGIWTYLWEGTGAASDAQAGTWTVSSTALNQLYCSDEELKSRLGITDTADDFEIRLAVATASRAIDQVCNRHFYRLTETRTYEPDDSCRVSIDDIVSVTTLKVDRDGDGTYEETWTQGTDYQLRPVNPNRLGEPWPYTRVRAIGSRTFPRPASLPGHPDLVQIAGPWGWPAVPLNVRMASLISATDLFRLKDAPFGIAGAGEFAVRIQANPRIMALLEPYGASVPLMA